MNLWLGGPSTHKYRPGRPIGAPKSIDRATTANKRQASPLSLFEEAAGIVPHEGSELPTNELGACHGSLSDFLVPRARQPAMLGAANHIFAFIVPPFTVRHLIGNLDAIAIGVVEKASHPPGREKGWPTEQGNAVHYERGEAKSWCPASDQRLSTGLGQSSLSAESPGVQRARGL